MTIQRLTAVAFAVITSLLSTLSADAATLTGIVQSGGTNSIQPRSNVTVTLYEATVLLPINRGFAKTDAAGHFSITSFKSTTNSIFFAVASGDLGVDLVTVIGPQLPSSITINELTTVAAAYSMAQFYREGFISGTAFQLQLAAGMNDNIVSPITGASSDVLLTNPNGDETNSLRSTRSLSNLVAYCVKNPLNALMLYQLTKTPWGLQPWNLPQALANLARNPGQNVLPIYALTLLNSSYGPVLQSPPDAWTVTVKVNNSGDSNILFGGPANIAFDSRGYAWVANNVVQGEAVSSRHVMVLKPNGQPADGSNGTPKSPLSGGGIYGVGFGVTIDPKGSVWFGNFGWGGKEPTTDGFGSVCQFSMSGTPISGPLGYHGGTDRVQGLAADRQGNVWLTSYGNDQLIVFMGGSQDNTASYPQPIDSKPFDVQIGADGTGWLVNGGGFSGAGPSGVSRYRLQTDPRTKKGTLTQIFDTRFKKALKAIALDSFGNGWVAAQGDTFVYHIGPLGTILGTYGGGGVYHPWGVAVDGEENIWVANFGPLQPNDTYPHSRISKLCGSNPLTRPPGMKVGDPISPIAGYTVPNAGCQIHLQNGDPLYGPGADPAYTPMMRLTSVVIDQAGNIWAVNNWKPDFNTDITSNPGGDGIVIFVGLAPPPRKKF